MKIDFIADTNFLIYLHEGNEIISPFLEYNIGVSFISEIELLGFKKLRNEEETALRKLLEDCFVFGWNRNFKETAIELSKKYSLKIPDSIIIATSIVFNIPLISADKEFSKVKELDLILLEF